MSILADLSDCFPDTISAQPVTLNAYGEFAASGDASALNCYISQKTRLIRDPVSGREVVSSVKVTVAGVFGLTTSGYRYTLPSRYDPRLNLEAMAVKPVSDEDGPHHEVLFFP